MVLLGAIDVCGEWRREHGRNVAQTVVVGNFQLFAIPMRSGHVSCLLTWDDIHPAEVVPVSTATTKSRISAAQAWRSCIQVIPSGSHSRFHRLRP